MKLAQLDSGRMVGAGLWNEVFVSDDDGCTFASIDHGFHGLTGGQPSNRNFDSVVAVGDEALLAGAFAPTLAVR